MTVAACIARMGTDNRAFMSYSQFYAQVGGVGGWVGLGGGGGGEGVLWREGGQGAA